MLSSETIHSFSSALSGLIYRQSAPKVKINRITFTDRIHDGIRSLNGGGDPRYHAIVGGGTYECKQWVAASGVCMGVKLTRLHSEHDMITDTVLGSGGHRFAGVCVVR
jgi:hypothetical protein